MQAVIYTHQLEPITVVSIKPELWRRLERGDHIQLPVPIRCSLENITEQFMLSSSVITVRIHGEVFARRGHRSLMLFTEDEEHALLLRPDYLPGQRGDMQRKVKDAHQLGFIKGFMEALDAFGGD